MQIDGALAGTPWRQAGAENGSARGSRFSGESGGDAFSRRGSAFAWRFMSAPFVLQAGLLLLVLTLGARVLSAQVPSQSQIALVIDDQGRVVYVNADIPPLLGAPSRAHGLAAAPDPIRQVIGTTASRFNMDPKFVDAVVRVESGYDVRARSSKGAQGLMQLIPATAARFGVENPFDPAENVRGGVTYLSQLMKQFNGDVPLTLAAYNAGEGAVARYGGIPPYRETRDYVRKVTEIYPEAAAAGRGAPANGSHVAKALPAGGARPPDNAASVAPIYQYVDERGVTHFAQ